jgi:hypothetical protein
MGLVAVTAGLFALGAYLGRDISYGWGWAFFIAAFACLIGLNVAAQRSERMAVTLLFGGGLDDREPGECAERSRRADRVPLPRPRRASRHGAA